MTKPQPFDRIRLGTIQAAIWRHTDSESRIHYGVTLERIYRDDQGNWQSSNSFARDELLTLAKVSDLANSRIHELQGVDRQQQRESQAATATAQQDASR